MQKTPDIAEANGKEIYKRLLGYVKPYWKAFIFAIVGMVIVASTEVGFAAIMKPMLDGTFVERDPFYLTFIPIALVSIFVVRGVGSFAVTYCMAWVGRHVIRDLREEMFDSLLRLPTAFYDKSPSGKLISKLIYDVEQVSDAASRALTILVQDMLILIGLLGWMFYLNWQLTLMFLIIGPVLSVMVVYINKRLRLVNKRLQSSVGDVTHVAQETIEGQRVIKIFGGQEYEHERFEVANQRNRQQFMKIVVTNATAVPVVQFVAASLLAVVIYLASRPDMQETITVGTFMSFITAFMLLFPPLKRLTTINAVLQKGIVAAQSVFTFLDSKKEKDNGMETLGPVSGKIEYRHVEFRYDEEGERVIDDFNLSISPGETVAFVGKSGSGKTTLVNLIPRFYNICGGQIFIDDKDTQTVKLSSLRQNIALVSQDITLFNDTIAHNIAYGAMSDATEEQIIKAAEAAHAMEFIRELPQGLNTIVGEKGMMLSGGQRQRLAIARAILKDAKILILDEATSALDTASERHIQVALEALMKNRTTLVVAHRLSTIESANKIVVLDSGKAIEVGTHQELIAKKSAYATLHKMQFGE